MSAERATARRLDQVSEVNPIPLVIDLDNALIQSDLLWESALAFVRKAPWRLWILLTWILKGRAFCKARLAQAVRLDTSVLPVNEALVKLAAEENARGRRIHLATAANEIFARQVAKRFLFIERVFASDESLNLKSQEKADRLTAAFPSGFIYAGDSRADLPVWRVASDIVIAGSSPAVVRDARRIREPIAIIERPNRWRAALKLLRPHQWAKNALVFIPLVLGGAASHPSAVLAATLAFVALSLIASGTYIANDLLDLDDDRRHWSKRNRPLASGALPISHGIGLAIGTLAVGFVLAAFAGAATLMGIAAYFIVTMAYSLQLKRIPIVDVLTLAGLFTLRLVIGTTASAVMLSPWLLTFSMFLFLSLSLAKRHTELARAAGNGKTPTGRGYVPQDQPMILALGIGALVASILVFVLYLTQEAFVATRLATPKLLWIYPPVLFLLGARIWLLSGRGELDDDPVAFAVKDRASLVAIALLALAAGVAWIGISL